MQTPTITLEQYNLQSMIREYHVINSFTIPLVRAVSVGVLKMGLGVREWNSASLRLRDV